MYIYIYTEQHSIITLINDCVLSYIYTNVDISHFLPSVYTLYSDYPSADNSTYFSVVFYNCISSIKKTTTIYSNYTPKEK